VGELLSGISSRELSEWRAYYELEPFGEERSDLRSGTIAAVVANTARDPKKRRRPYKASDFMHRFDQEPGEERPRWEAQLALVEQLNVAFGGRDERKHE
jgi:hypothetical protein